MRYFPLRSVVPDLVAQGDGVHEDAPHRGALGLLEVEEGVGAVSRGDSGAAVLPLTSDRAPLQCQIPHRWAIQSCRSKKQRLPPKRGQSGKRRQTAGTESFKEKFQVSCLSPKENYCHWNS